MGIWTLPKLIYETGTVASFIILFISAIFSYIVASFINEIQGNGNAIKKLGLTRDNESKSLDEDKHTLLNEDESRSLEDSSIYAVTERIELSMAVKTILGERSVKGNKIRTDWLNRDGLYLFCNSPSWYDPSVLKK